MVLHVGLTRLTSAYMASARCSNFHLVLFLVFRVDWGSHVYPRTGTPVGGQEAVPEVRGQPHFIRPLASAPQPCVLI